MNTTLSLSDAIDQLLAEDKIASLPAWEGAPLGFTSRYYSAADLDAAAERRALVDATKPWHDRHPSTDEEPTTAACQGERADECGRGGGTECTTSDRRRHECPQVGRAGMLSDYRRGVARA